MADRTCSIEGCPGKVYGRGWCAMHWKRWYTKGDPLALKHPHRLDPETAAATMRAAGLEPKIPYPGNNRTPWLCVCAKCGADVSPTLGGIRSGQGGCWACGVQRRADRQRTDPETALGEMRRAGIEPRAPFPGHLKTPWPGTCMDCGADVAPTLGSIRSGRGGCLSCGNRRSAQTRSGEGSPPWRGDDVGYSALHVRIRTQRGNAIDHACVDCGRPAEDWSYNGGSDRERISEERHSLGLRYSPDLDSYSPRCRPCHRAWDKGMDA